MERPRRSKGQPTGGQFASRQHGESDIGLDGPAGATGGAEAPDAVAAVAAMVRSEAPDARTVVVGYDPDPDTLHAPYVVTVEGADGTVLAEHGDDWVYDVGLEVRDEIRSAVGPRPGRLETLMRLDLDTGQVSRIA